jgi:2-polyprenyl-6-methoxyphenol hydroxylase-like FAD-dependent oxidoreductase
VDIRTWAAENTHRQQKLTNERTSTYIDDVTDDLVSDAMTDAATVPVVINGAGPTGLLLAAELRLVGVAPVVLERLAQISEVPKGNGLFGQIVSVLDYRGLRDPMAADATYCGPVPGFAFGPLHLDFSPLPASPLQVLALQQRKIERHLSDRLHALGGNVRRGHELMALAQHDDHVLIEVTGPDGPYQIRAEYLVGCDGARSVVRKQAGIEFPGITSGDVSRIGRVRLPDAVIVPGTGEVEVPGAGRLQPAMTKLTAQGRISIMPLSSLDKAAEPGLYIVATMEEDPGAKSDTPVSLDELRASVRRVLGADLPMSDPQWLTRTVGNSRLADRYLAGRVLLAGDAAHLFGIGGAMNVGLMDAMNLGWKLAAQVLGLAPQGLLDSYHGERHAAAQRYQLQARAQKALSASGEYAEALRQLVDELLRYAEPVRHVGELIEGSAVRYDVGQGRTHPLEGQLVPDVRLRTPDGSTRVAELMRPGRTILLDLTGAGSVAAAVAGWSPAVTIVTAKPDGPAPADALLIRPDGFVAWASGPGGPDGAPGLTDALRRWVPRAG